MQQVVGVFVGRAVSQSEKRIQARERSARQVRFHFLRLVQNHDGARGLDEIERRVAAETVGFAVDDIEVSVERLDIDGQHAGVARDGEIAHGGQFGGIVFAPFERLRISRAQMGGERIERVQKHLRGRRSRA